MVPRPMRRPTKQGSTLILSCLVAFVLALGIIFLIDMSSVYISYQTLCDSTDRAALSAAAALNEGDRAGRINHLIAQSRDLIMRNRQAVALTGAPPFDRLRPLCAQLLEQARSGAILLEQERTALVSARLAEIKERLKNKHSPSAEKGGQPGPEVLEIDIGTVQGLTSGVPSALVEGTLKDFDLKEHYIDKRTGLYLGEINAKMPDEDGDLKFKLCTLPSLAKESALQKGVEFKQYAVLVKDGQSRVDICDQMPASVVVKSSGTYKGLIFQRSYSVKASATASTAGPAFQ
jgi:hypothetical protein